MLNSVTYNKKAYPTYIHSYRRVTCTVRYCDYMVNSPKRSVAVWRSANSSKAINSDKLVPKSQLSSRRFRPSPYLVH